MSVNKEMMSVILDKLEEASNLRKAGQTHQARENFFQLLEKQLPEEIKKENPSIYIRANIEAGMCAMLTGDAPAALAFFHHIENPEDLTPEASLLYAKAQLTGDEAEEKDEAKNRLINLLHESKITSSTEISVMCQLLLSIAALQQDDFETTETHLTNLLETLKLDTQLSVIFAEKMQYFITDTEINALSRCEKLFPLQHTLLDLKKIDAAMPNLHAFFPPIHKKKLSFSSFLVLDEESPNSHSEQNLGHW